MTTGMLSWLHQQIEARRALAESASPGPWTANAEHDEVLAVDGERVADGFALSGNQLRNTVDHIAFNDPRQIIADCEADLEIADLHGRDAMDACRACGGYFPCLTLLAVVSRYRHRPGYLPEWAPERITP